MCCVLFAGARVLSSFFSLCLQWIVRVLKTKYSSTTYFVPGTHSTQNGPPAPGNMFRCPLSVEGAHGTVDRLLVLDHACYPAARRQWHITYLRLSNADLIPLDLTQRLLKNPPVKAKRGLHGRIATERKEGEHTDEDVYVHALTHFLYLVLFLDCAKVTEYAFSKGLGEFQAETY